MDFAEARRLLRVGPSVDAETLRGAFRQAVKDSHPDRPGGDGERLRLAIEAFQRLRQVVEEVTPPPPEVLDSPDARLEITPAEALSGGWTRISLAGGEISVRLPAGLRAGELVRISGRTFKVKIRNRPGAMVAGDDYLQTVQVPRDLMATGGRVMVETPAGEQLVWFSRADAERGFARVSGLGLPARAGRRRGDLLLRLKPAPDERFDTPVQAKRREFAAAWAA
jgi:DnaJ-class molecular chaperone